MILLLLFLFIIHSTQAWGSALDRTWKHLIGRLHTDTAFLSLDARNACRTTRSAGTMVSFFIASVEPYFSAMSKNSVSTGPGQTAVTQIPFFLSSSLSAMEKLST